MKIHQFYEAILIHIHKDENDNAELTNISIDILERNDYKNKFLKQFYHLETYI